MAKSLGAVVLLAAALAANAPAAAQNLRPAPASEARVVAAAAGPDDLELHRLLATYPAPIVPAGATDGGTGGSRALVIGAGAIAGVVALNLYMGGLAYLPFTGVVAATPAAAAESVVAISRVYAVTSAVAGGLIANWLYERSGR